MTIRISCVVGCHWSALRSSFPVLQNAIVPVVFSHFSEEEQPKKKSGKKGPGKKTTKGKGKKTTSKNDQDEPEDSEEQSDEPTATTSSATRDLAQAPSTTQQKVVSDFTPFSSVYSRTAIFLLSLDDDYLYEFPERYPHRGFDVVTKKIKKFRKFKKYTMTLPFRITIPRSSYLEIKTTHITTPNVFEWYFPNEETKFEIKFISMQSHKILPMHSILQCTLKPFLESKVVSCDQQEFLAHRLEHILLVDLPERSFLA